MTSDGSAGSGAIPVLMYHSISTFSTDRFRPFVVPPQLFAEHLGWLAAHHYITLTAAQFAGLRRDGLEPAPRSVVLTFDDAFRDFVDLALPVLEQHGMCATLYVPTGFVGSTSRWLVAEGEQRRAILSWKDLASLPPLGVECGAHSHSHAQLDLLNRRAAAREIALSQALLQTHLQAPVTSFAYPFGYSSRGVRELVRQQGFLSAFAVGDLPSLPDDDPYAVPRITVTADTTTADLDVLLLRPRAGRDVASSRARALASRVLRTARLKKHANAPERAPAPTTLT